MIKKFSINSIAFLCCTLFVLNFCYAIPLLMKPMDSEGDAYGRAMAFPLMGSGIFAMEGGVWLPLYGTFISASQFLPGEAMMTPRYAALLSACFIPVLIFLLTKTATKHTGISFVTALLFILFPLFHEIGAVTLSETLFLALFLGALYSLLQENYTGFSLLLILSQMTRFEAWFVTPWLILLIIALKKIPVPKKVLLIGLCVIFPLFYSSISYFTRGSAAGYAREMETMAEVNYIEGRNDFPVAITRWTEKFWQVVPMSFVGLFGVGMVIFLRERKTSSAYEMLGQFIFVILPIFLFVMLPIQLFLPFRDWLPTRYFLIPVTLLFPLIGKALQFLIFKYDWRRFWQWYLLVLLFAVFELYSLQLNTHTLLKTYNHLQFEEIYQTLEYSVKDIVLKAPDTKVYVYNSTEFDAEVPVLDLGVVRYFLLPFSIYQVEYVTQENLALVLARGPNTKIVVAPTKQILPSELPLKTLFQGQYYSFYITQ